MIYHCTYCSTFFGDSNKLLLKEESGGDDYVACPFCGGMNIVAYKQIYEYNGIAYKSLHELIQFLNSIGKNEEEIDEIIENKVLSLEHM